MIRSIVLVVVLGYSAFAAEPIITTLEGKTHPLKLSADGQIEAVVRGEIFSVAFRTKVARETSGFVVLTDGGDRFSTTAIESDDSKLKLTTDLLGEIALQLAAVRSIRQAGFDAQPRARQELAKAVAANPTRDVLLIEKDAATLALVGLLKGVRDNRFVFHWQDEDRQVESGKVLALALASATARLQMSKEAIGVVGDTDVLTGKLGAITAAAIVLDSPLLGAVKIPREKVAALEFVVGRRVYVSDLTPTEVREAGFFGESFGWQRDASVEGRPLRLRREGKIEEFAKGLGTHARCELLYKLDGKFHTFTAVIGIDAEANARGAAEFVVLADGKEVFRSGKVKATDDPRRIFVPIAGAQTLTLRSDFAPNTLGVAAHADWADLQLVE